MTENQRGTTKQPPWQRDGDAEAVPFGAWLRRQREMREITLREISDSTKISLRYLEALEDERFDLLPAMVFAKGFLRQYARYVGLDADEVVNRFLVAAQDEEPEDEPGGELEELAGPAHGSGGTWKYALLVIALVALVVALAFFLPRLIGGDDPGEPVAGAASDTAGSAADAGRVERIEGREPASVTVPGPGAATRSPRIDPDAPLRVTLDFREDCWVEAVVDGERRVSEMRVQGESLQLQAQETVELRLGNAGVVDVEVNGEPYPLDAAPGDVRRVEIDLSDVPGAQPEGGAVPDAAAGIAEELRAAGPQP